MGGAGHDGVAAAAAEAAEAAEAVGDGMLGAAGRTIVVGGAGGTAGREVCAALTAAGAHVVAVTSRADALEEIAAAETHALDLGDASAVASLATDLRERREGVDGFIHLVGGWRPGVADDDWQWLEHRVLTTLRVSSRELRGDLGASDAGRLAILSSASVAAPRWGMANYVALKAAAETWVAAIANGWRVTKKPAAAVTFVVRALDDEGVIDALAQSVVALWDLPADELNGVVARLDDAE